MPTRKKTKNKTKEEELWEKLLKKTLTSHYPIFKPANLSAFQIAAVNWRATPLRARETTSL